MPKTDVIHMRVSPEIKGEAESILAKLGMSTTDAINIFLSQVILRRGLPFEVRLPSPNEATRKAMSDAENDNDLRRFDSPDAMFKELGL